MDPEGLRAYLKYLGCDYDLPQRTLTALCQALDAQIRAVAERSRREHEERFHTTGGPEIGSPEWESMRAN